MIRDRQPSVTDLGFMDSRAKTLDLAAFLDRADRHGESADFRVRALLEAIPLLLEKKTGRVAAILEHLSDLSTEPIPAAHTQSACGAPPPASEDA